MGAGGRRLMFDSFTKVKELDQNIDSAYDISKKMTDTFKAGKEYSDKIDSVYKPLMNMVG